MRIEIVGCWRSQKPILESFSVYLIHNGVEVSLPRDVLKQAFHHQLIQDGQVWIDMLEDHNLMEHAWQEQVAITAVKNIRARYAPAIEQTYRDLLNKQSL